MPPKKKTVTQEKALFIITAHATRTKNLIQEVMTPQDLEATGVGRLTAQEKANLNAWLDPDKVVAPGDQPQ